MKRSWRSWRSLLLCMALLMAGAAHAWCEQNENVLPPQKHVAITKLFFGNINLTDEALQPYGTPLARFYVPPADYEVPGANPDTVLWECDAADLGHIQFLVATHADWRFGGMYENAPGEHVYLTAFKHVGLRLRMDGVTLTNHWQPVPVRSYLKYKDKKGEVRIAVRLRDIPVIEAELYKISHHILDEDIFGCNQGSDRKGARIDYKCDSYNGYLQLAGPGLMDDVPGTLATASHAYTFNLFGSDSPPLAA